MRKTLNTKWIVGLSITFICCAFYATLISFKTMPIAEGWYSEYAWLINHGKLPYRDFEYLFFPLYIYFIAGFTKIFGYSIIALRILGIVLFGAIGGGLYWLYSKLFSNFAALIAAVSSALFLQSEVVQIFYDYIRLHDLLAMITTIFLVYLSCKCLRKENITNGRFTIVVQFATPILLLLASILGLYQSIYSAHRIRLILFVLFFCSALIWLIATFAHLRKAKRPGLFFLPKEAVLCGIFVAAECMVKQSTGMLMIVYVLIFLLFSAIVLKNKNFLRSFLGALIGLIFAFSILLIFLLATGSFEGFVECCFKSALAAKGGLINELFRWIPTAWPSFWSERIQVLLLAVIIEFMIELAKHRQSLQSEKNLSFVVVGITGFILILISWLFVHSYTLATMADAQYNNNLPAFAFFTCSIAFFIFAFYLIIRFIKKDENDISKGNLFLLFPVLGVIFTQGYGVGMSGGLVSSQTAIGFGLLVAFCLQMAMNAGTPVLLTSISIFSAFLMATFIGQKSVETYNWWGLTQGSIWEHTESVDVPLLQGIKVRPTDKAYYETVYQDVVENTEADDTIFAFPHCPIFYTITNRHSNTYSQVQWFDVSSSQAIEEDIITLRENPPKVIIYANVPDSVYEGHESSFQTYQTREMRDFLVNELIPENDYELLHEMDIGNGYSISTFLLEN